MERRVRDYHDRSHGFRQRWSLDVFIPHVIWQATRTVKMRFTHGPSITAQAVRKAPEVSRMTVEFARRVRAKIKR
jgi:hypothetical protein